MHWIQKLVDKATALKRVLVNRSAIDHQRLDNRSATALQ